MPVTESNFPLQPSSSHSNFLGPRRRALTIPLPRSPFQPPDSLLEDLSTTRKHLVKSPSRMKTLFKFRKRSLSLVYPLIQATHDQSQSHICTLPREIRDQIWKLLIDESPFAIHILYPWEMKHSQLRSCAALHEINPAKALNLKPLEMSNLRNKALLQGLLNLTRTCRVVYSEVIELWYEKLHIVFCNSNLFNGIIFRLQNHRLVHLNIHGNTDSYSNWVKMCQSLNQLPSLKTLRISFFPNSSYFQEGSGSGSATSSFRWRFYEALCLVRGVGDGRELEVFEVTAPWPCMWIVAWLVLDEDIEKIAFDIRGSDGEYLAKNAIKIKKLVKEGQLEMPGLEWNGQVQNSEQWTFLGMTILDLDASVV